jgi:hypothetical protein
MPDASSFVSSYTIRRVPRDTIIDTLHVMATTDFGIVFSHGCQKT